MAVVEMQIEPARAHTPARLADRPPRDLQRTLRLVLATFWLLDAVLQLQPLMFTRGASGFSGMLDSVAQGNPTWVAHSITWNASVVSGHPILTNTAFALIQFLIGIGIVFKRTRKTALAISIVWALGVWWFGEGAGAVFHGGATPLGGGPGAVLFYALLAAVLWPTEGRDAPFIASRTMGVRAARAVWVATWLTLALLCVIGSGRSSKTLGGIVSAADVGQPGWLARIDRGSESLLLHHGATIAVLLALVCVLVAAGVFLRPTLQKATLTLAMVTFAVIWVAVQNFGGILAGGATDPNSGPLVLLLAIAYWPVTDARDADLVDSKHGPFLAREA